MSTIRLLRLALLSTTLLTAAPAAPFAQQTESDAPAQQPTQPPAETPAQSSIRVLPPPAPPETSAPADSAVRDAPLAAAFASNAEVDASEFGDLADIQACPYKQIRAAYDEAVTGKDTLDTLAVEREILILCDERNTLVAKLLEGEERLAKLLKPDTAPTVAVTGSIEESPTSAAPLDRLSAAPGQGAETSPSPSTGQEQAPAIGTDRTQAQANPSPPPAPGQCEPLYATRYISPASAETGTTAQAGITDTSSGTELTVKVGDTLTGGYVVDTITPSGVTLSRDNQILPLPGFDAPVEAEGFYAGVPGADPESAAENSQ